MKWDDIADMPCSVARTLSVIGDRWTMLILRDAFRHPVRFERLHEKFGVTRHVLAGRLDRLVEQRVMERILYQERPDRYEYALTAKGRALYPVMLAMIAWADEWMDGGRGAPIQLRHHRCGQIIAAACTCPRCGEALSPENVAGEKGPGWPVA